MDTMGLDVVGDEVMGDDAMGDDVTGDDVVGARSAMMRRALHRGLRLPSALQGASTQGISRPKEELDALPFSLTAAIPTGVLAAGFSTALEAFPQRPFRGERLILTAQRINAGVVTDVSSLLAITPAWYVGAVQVGASQGLMPFSAFAATAFGVRLAVPPAGQGTRIFIPFQLQFAQVAGDQTIVTAVLIGRAVR